MTVGNEFENDDWEIMNGEGEWVSAGSDHQPQGSQHDALKLAGKIRPAKRGAKPGNPGKVDAGASGSPGKARVLKGQLSQAARTVLEHFVAPVAVQVVADELGSFIFKHPADSIKNADGTRTYNDGTIATDTELKHPDGSVSTPDGDVKYPNNAIYNRRTGIMKFPDGSEAQAQRDENGKPFFSM